MKKLNTKAFTIIELLIAILIFTSVLLLCLEGITRIGKIYIKNSSTSRTSQFIKSMSDEISRQIRYGSSEPAIDDRTGEADKTYRFCVNGNAYKVKFNTLTDPVSKKSDPSCGTFTSTDSDFFANGTENVAPSGMRVLKFEINQIDGIWTVSIRVALGESDLLVDVDENQLTDSTTSDKFNGAKCRSGIAGSEFCSVLELTTSATPRM